MRASTVNQRVSAADGYRRWASVYDAEENPMLSLEQRFLNCLLPSANGRDVVDLGCGTGRWLETFVDQSPRSLIGIDASAEMLARAAEKLGRRATLLCGGCEAPLITPDSADLILCSFVLSYVADLQRLVKQIQRIARPGADIFIVDLHPHTEAKFGWRHGFRDGGAHVDFMTQWRSLESVIQEFELRGFQTAALLEPSFGDPEFGILKRAGKADLIGTLRTEPAIYILQLRAAQESERPHGIPDRSGYLGLVCGARIALGPTESVNAEIGFADGRIASLHSRTGTLTARNRDSRSPDLSGFLILPGLVNAHDHLEFALFPRLGKGAYPNFLEWADDIHRSEALRIGQHRSVRKKSRLWWGAIRNLLCGATTVCHHNPFVAEVFDNGFPIRVVRDFGWAHSLRLEPNVAERHDATPKAYPFILHLAEGLDTASSNELLELERIGALTDRTVVVHGLGLDERGLTLLKRLRAGLVWCPSSNDFLFGRTHSRETIEKLPLVALGSDSSLTAQGDLLDELQFAYKRVGLQEEELYGQVTLRAARLLRLHSGEGSIAIGAIADLIAIRDKGLTPAETVAQSSYRHIELVVIGGRVQLASSRMKDKLADDVAEGLERLEIGGEVRWIRAPLARLFEEAKAALGREIRMNGRLLNYAAA